MSNPPNRNEVFVFSDLETLQKLPLAELESLWELVPTDRQRLYKSIYDRTRCDEGASGSDALETEMVKQLLAHYAEKALVPVGTHWVCTPPQVQDAAREGAGVTGTDSQVPQTGKRPSPVLLLIGVACIVAFGFLILRGTTGKRTVMVGTGTQTRTPTATLVRTYTPTPLALDSQDSIIRGGNGGSGQTAIFPVNLRVQTTKDSQPRIFVVQRRVIQTTEWNYEDNPDTASYLAGLMVRPVLGIPWSEANAALFQAAEPGTVFTLQMNTGASQRFRFTSRGVFNRGDTSAFGQTVPGLVLVLFGVHDSETGNTEPDRTVLTADYLPEQELSGGVLAGVALPSVALVTATPTLLATPAQRVDVQIISVSSSQGWVRVRLRLFNGRFERLHLDEKSIWLSYGYNERPVGPHISAMLDAIDLEPAQAADLTVLFAWHGEPFAALTVLDEYRYSLSFRPEP